MSNNKGGMRLKKISSILLAILFILISNYCCFDECEKLIKIQLPEDINYGPHCFNGCMKLKGQIADEFIIIVNNEDDSSSSSSDSESESSEEEQENGNETNNEEENDDDETNEED